MTTKISGNNLQADISIDTTGNQIFNGTLKLDANFPTGTDNVALGNTALDNGSLTGSQNVAIGAGTLTDTDSGADNTAIGFEALKVVTTGTNNTGIGSGAGSTITSGSNLTLVGYNATPSAVDATNEITLGDANVTDVRIPGAGFYIDGGNVGIGTATPAVALDVVGAISATGNLTSLGIDDNATSTAITIDSSEKVGIGTSSPSELLHLSSTTNAKPTILIETVNDGANGGRLDFLHKSASPADGDLLGDITFGGYSDSGTPPSDFARYVMMKAYAEDVSDGAEKGRLTFSIHSGSGNENNVDVLTLNGTKVGIGTTSPISPLTVNSGSNNVGLFYGNTGNNYIEISDNNNTNKVSFGSLSGGNAYLFSGSGKYTALYSGGSERMRIHSNGDVAIGTTASGADLELETTEQSSGNSLGSGGICLRNSGTVNAEDVLPITGRLVTSAAPRAGIGFIAISQDGIPGYGGAIGFYTRAAADGSTLTPADERMRIDKSGNVLVGSTSAANYSLSTGDGFTITQSSRIWAAVAGDFHIFNRTTNDGTIIQFRQAGTEEGSISVSGATVSYNGFTGTHWSRFTDNSKPTILRGTVLESLDEMCDWYNLEFNDNDGNPQKISHVLADGQSNSDVITYNHEGTDYQATIVKEADIKHVKSKVSDTVDAKNVYGVFVAYDEDGEGYNDFYVASVGSFVVRIKQGETIAKGDLLQSNGDGTAKVQTDDAIRSSSFAKVLSTTVIETYEDGSYLVPCSLMC